MFPRDNGRETLMLKTPELCARHTRMTVIVVRCAQIIAYDAFNRHSELNSQSITKTLFERNLYDKKSDQGFSTNMQYLIHPSIYYVFKQACD